MKFIPTLFRRLGFLSLGIFFICVGLFYVYNNSDEMALTSLLETDHSHLFSRPLSPKPEYLTGLTNAYQESNDSQVQSALMAAIDYSETSQRSISMMMPCEGCPRLQIVSLDGVAGFPSANIMNQCGAADTIALLIVNEGECDVTDISLTINYDDGLIYGGFVMPDLANSSPSSIMTTSIGDLSNPEFMIDVLPGRSRFHF